MRIPWNSCTVFGFIAPNEPHGAFVCKTLLSGPDGTLHVVQEANAEELEVDEEATAQAKKETIVPTHGWPGKRNHTIVWTSY